MSCVHMIGEPVVLIALPLPGQHVELRRRCQSASVCAAIDVQRLDSRCDAVVPQDHCKTCDVSQRKLLKRKRAESGARRTAIHQVGFQSKPAQSLFPYADVFNNVGAPLVSLSPD